MSKISLMILLLLSSLSAYSGPPDLGYVEIEVDKAAGVIKTVFDFNPGKIENSSQAFHKTLGRNFWKSGNYKCQWQNIKSQVLSSDRVRVFAESYCPEMNSTLSLNLGFLSKASSAYKVIGRITSNGVESTFIADKTNHKILVSDNVEKMFGSFVYQGVDLAQIMVLFLFVPLIYLIRKYSNYQLQLSRFAGVIVMIAGSYWFVERTFL